MCSSGSEGGNGIRYKKHGIFNSTESCGVKGKKGSSTFCGGVHASHVKRRESGGSNSGA